MYENEDIKWPCPIWGRARPYTVGGHIPSIPEGTSAPLQREGVMPMYVTYAELFSFCLVILGVIGVVLNAKKK